MERLGQRILKLVPQYRERVWGGRRLVSGEIGATAPDSRVAAASKPIGEAWIAYGPSVVAEGPLAARTLDQLIETNAADLLGAEAAARYGQRFPLLIKLLECRDWLSVQVHPNDEQARRMVGPDEYGKTEAWYFLEADAGARILAGVKPGTSRAALATAIRQGRIVEVADTIDVHAGEALLVPAGTLHALGPGLLLYEIQQASDTTYRAYDWDRPQSAGRKLHIEESVEVTTTDRALDRTHPRLNRSTSAARAVECRYFDLDAVRVQAGVPFAATTDHRAFNILTVVEGCVEIACGEERLTLARFETALVAGAAGDYRVDSSEPVSKLLRAAIPNQAR